MVLRADPELRYPLRKFNQNIFATGLLVPTYHDYYFLSFCFLFILCIYYNIIFYKNQITFFIPHW